MEKALNDFAKRITQHSHFEHIGKNVHRVIEVETVINIFRDILENLRDHPKPTQL